MNQPPPANEGSATSVSLPVRSHRRDSRQRRVTEPPPGRRQDEPGGGLRPRSLAGSGAHGRGRKLSYAFQPRPAGRARAGIRSPPRVGTAHRSKLEGGRHRRSSFEVSLPLKDAARHAMENHQVPKDAGHVPETQETVGTTSQESRKQNRQMQT